MGASFSDIEQQARTLTAEERAKLAEMLLESLSEPFGEIETAWSQEIEERVAALERGATQTYPAEDVFAEARRLKRQRLVPLHIRTLARPHRRALGESFCGIFLLPFVIDQTPRESPYLRWRTIHVGRVTGNRVLRIANASNRPAL